LIEHEMVTRMTRRAALVFPLVLLALWPLGHGYALSAGAGLALTLINLWVAGVVIGRVAETSPGLLLPAGLIAFCLGLALVIGGFLLAKQQEAISLPVMGLALIVGHLGLVLWEAATGRASYDRVARASSASTRAEARS
jgi:hypothetical protein